MQANRCISGLGSTKTAGRLCLRMYLWRRGLWRILVPDGQRNGESDDSIHGFLRFWTPKSGDVDFKILKPSTIGNHLNQADHAAAPVTSGRDDPGIKLVSFGFVGHAAVMRGSMVTGVMSQLVNQTAPGHRVLRVCLSGRVGDSRGHIQNDGNFI